MPGVWDVPLKNTKTSILHGDMIKAVRLFGPLRRPSTKATQVSRLPACLYPYNTARSLYYLPLSYLILSLSTLIRL